MVVNPSANLAQGGRTMALLNIVLPTEESRLIIRFLARLDVGHDDGDDQPDAGDGSEEKEDHRETGIAEYLKRGLNAHQHSRSHDERREDESKANPVRYLLHALEHDLFVDGINIQFELIVADRVQDLVNARRQFLRKLLEFDYPADQVCRSDALHQVALQDLHGALANDRGGLKAGVESEYRTIKI